jgi:hypothetical protein
VGDASSAVELFITDNKAVAEDIAQKLCIEKQISSDNRE